MTDDQTLPRVTRCPVCGAQLGDHTGGARLEHDVDDQHIYHPGPLPAHTASVDGWCLDCSTGDGPVYHDGAPPDGGL